MIIARKLACTHVRTELRSKLCSAAVRLTESIKYGSAGTIEFLVDDRSGDFFFLEMNTRLQVEHGITELCYGVDLVKLMLDQADAQLAGKGGLHSEELAKLQPSNPTGAAIEARVYAEIPAKDYAPSPGTLQIVDWKLSESSRVDTWIHTGTVVSSHYDPLLAKVMVHTGSREQSIQEAQSVLSQSRICGPPTNLDFLASIVADAGFSEGSTMTKFLANFKYSPNAMDVISGGAYTTVQDYPGRPTMGRGFPHSGPMDPVAFQIANLLVGNPPGTEGLECTLDGPELRFLSPAVIALCGAPMEVEVDGESMQMWSRHSINAGQKLKIGKTTGGGCRSYLAIYGGLPSVAAWFGSKATSPGVAVGGYQGRQLTAGDLLSLVKEVPDNLQHPLALPDGLIPDYPGHWNMLAMPGPYQEDYLTDGDVEMIYKTKWQISHNAARGGIRLIGPKPKFARQDGGEGGGHPSNVAEYGYPVGTLNWTGDDPCIFPVDCPDFGGFISSTTIIKADYWKMGQMKAGNTMQYIPISLDAALSERIRIDVFIESIAEACSTNGDFSNIKPLHSSPTLDSISLDDAKAIIHQIPQKGNQPQTYYRQGADSYLLVEYGDGTFDLNHRCRVTALNKALSDAFSPINFSSGLINTVGCCTSLLLNYDILRLRRSKLLTHLIALESQLGDLSATKVPSRLFHLPILFNSPKEKAAITRYMETQRPYASYLPDNLDFVARNNSLQRDDLIHILLTSKLIAVSVGFFAALPLCLPVDPRLRLNCPKMNPSRVFTPEGQVSWGGSCMALYNVESPGGYQLTGLTIPGCDILGSKRGYSLERPWLFEDFDQLTFYEVQEEEYERELALFHSGRYEYKIEDTVFDMAEHNALLQSTRDEVRAMKARQKRAQDSMQQHEDQLMAKWMEEKAAGKVPMDKVEALLSDPQITKITSPLNANVWKVVVGEGDEVAENTAVAVLEAMKLEISVNAEAEYAGGRVEKLIVRPGDVVNAGDPICLVRK